MKVVVIGAGVAGLAAALACGRAGHEVTLLERDDEAAPDDPREAPNWERHGIPHFLQPHAFLARGIRELRSHAPDVYEALLDAGAYLLDLTRKMPPGEDIAGDDDLRFLGCRRPVMEAVLRRKALAESRVRFMSATTVRGFEWEEPGAEIPRVTAVLLDDGPLPADLVVDAAGRASPVSEWIIDGGGRACAEEVSDCGLVYYSRYYRFKPGAVQREGPWLLAPRVELGYYELGTFWGDNETFSCVQQIHPDDRELRLLRHPDAFTAALRSVKPAAYLMDDAVSESITDVLPMGQLRNTWRSFVHDGRPIVDGVVSIGDALCHTNPRYAWGLSLSLSQAFMLARCLERGDVDSSVASFYAATAREVRTVFEVASETDAARTHHWRDGGLDLMSFEDALPLFLLYTFPMAGMFDRDIFRAAVARLMLLEDPRQVERDEKLLGRAAGLVRDASSKSPTAPQGPSREEMLALMRSSKGV